MRSKCFIVCVITIIGCVAWAIISNKADKEAARSGLLHEINIRREKEDKMESDITDIAQKYITPGMSKETVQNLLISEGFKCYPVRERAWAAWAKNGNVDEVMVGIFEINDLWKEGHLFLGHDKIRIWVYFKEGRVVTATGDIVYIAV